MHARYTAAIGAIALLVSAMAAPQRASADPPVIGECTFAVTPLRLGNYNSFAHVVTAEPMTLSYSCSDSSVKPGVVRLTSSSGDTVRRYMTDANGNRLYYEICLDPQCKEPIGPRGVNLSSSGARRAVSGSSDTVSGMLALYGVIAPLQDVHAGPYHDNVTVSTVY